MLQFGYRYAVYIAAPSRARSAAAVPSRARATAAATLLRLAGRDLKGPVFLLPHLGWRRQWGHTPKQGVRGVGGSKPIKTDGVERFEVRLNRYLLGAIPVPCTRCGDDGCLRTCGTGAVAANALGGRGTKGTWEEAVGAADVLERGRRNPARTAQRMPVLE